MDNGDKGRGFKSQLFAVLDDHLELASLEWVFEKKQNVRRMAALIGIGILVLAAFVFVNIALVHALVTRGGSVTWVCLSLSLVYVLISAVLYRFADRRDPRVGEPFQGTREELDRSLKWIQKHFS